MCGKTSRTLLGQYVYGPGAFTPQLLPVSHSARHVLVLRPYLFSSEDPKTTQYVGVLIGDAVVPAIAADWLVPVVRIQKEAG